MTRSFIPAITTGLRPTPLIIVYGAKPAARAFSSRRSKMYFFDFCCLFPATFRQSASFSSTNIDAYYLILACKAREHIDFNFTVDANIVRLFVAISLLVAESFRRILSPPFHSLQAQHGAQSHY